MWIRTTMQLRDDHLEKLKLFSLYGGVALKDALEKILDDFFSKSSIPSLPKIEKNQLKKIFGTHDAES